MRQALSHWFRIPRKDEAALWKDGLLCFDASVLLNIYAYSNETRNELVALIEGNADRLRLPYQYGLEYARNRGAVVVKQVNNYLKAEKELDVFQKEQIESKRDHPYLSAKSIKDLEGIRNDLAARRKEMEGLIGADSYADKLLAVFDGKLGPPPTEEQLADLHEQVKERYDRKFPPGYVDLKDKTTPEAYGDCIGWLQLIEIAKRENKGVLLITDDLKEDWWLIEKERTIGPRPELIAEFASATGQRVWIYNSVNFLRAAREFKAGQVGDQAFDEISARLASQLEVIRTRKFDPALEESLKTGFLLEIPPEKAMSGPTTDKLSALESEKAEPPNDTEGR